MSARQRLPELLQGPLRRRVGGDVEVQDLPAIVREDDETGQVAKRGGRNSKKVDRDKLFGMIAEKGLPGLRRGLYYLDPLFGHSGLGDVEPE